VRQNILFNFLSRTWVHGISLVFFVCIFNYIHFDLTRIDLFDETLYLNLRNSPNVAWGPLYSSFYKFLSLVINSPLLLHDFSFVLVTSFIVPISLFLLFLKLGANSFQSLIISLSLSLSQTFIAAVPHIHKFNFSVLTLLFVYLYDDRSSLKKYLFFGGWGLSLFIRQENIIGFVFFVIFNFVFEKRFSNLRRIKNLLLYFSIFSLGVILLLLVWGSPIDPRSFAAFIDHFRWRNPELALTFSDFDQRFPGATSVFTFLVNYPSDFFSHILKNIITLPIILIKATSTSLGRVSSLIFFLSLFVFFIIFPIQSISRNRSTLIFSGSLALQALILVILLQPWTKYLPALSVFVMILFILLASRFSRLITKVNHSINFLIGLIASTIYGFCIALHFFFCDGTFFETHRFENHPRALIKQLSSTLQDTESIMTIDHLGLYLKDRYLLKKSYLLSDYTFHRFDNESFTDFMIRNKINVFCFLDSFVTPWILANPQEYATIHDFINSAHEHGYEIKIIHDTQDKFRCFKRDFYSQ